MTWNYRVTRQWVGPEKNDYEFSIREIYYARDGEVLLWSANPVAPTGEIVEEVIETILLMGDATSRPVIDLDMLGNEIAEAT